MNRLFIILMALSLLFVSCEEKGEPSYKPKPACQIKIISSGYADADVEIKDINAEKTKYLCLKKENSFDAKAEDIIEAGADVPSKRFKIIGLEENSEYHLFAAAYGMGQYSAVQRDTIITSNDPSNDFVEEEPKEPEDPDSPEEPEQPDIPEEPEQPIEPDQPDTPETPDIPVEPEEPEVPVEPEIPMTPEGLYMWEAARTEIPAFADMALCYGGHSSRNPSTWTKERFAKTALYTDREGHEHWLFDAMLMLELWDDNGAVTYSIENVPEYPRASSTKIHWERLLDYWFDETTGFQALDDCICEAADRIGEPDKPRYIVYFLPDPVYFENFTNAMKGSNRNTVYWGAIDGVRMDFSKLDHRYRAYKWYIDQVRERFAQKRYKHIELLGFYILSETLTMSGGWNYKYKQHDKIIPMVADYCHSVNEGLYWIPYSVSDWDDGHNKALKNWKSFGFDLTILQPNYYWDDKSWAVTCDYINEYDMGMEFEFEGSHGGYTSILGDSEAAIYRKERFREYMENARNYGIYGKKPIVLYTGTNALYELAASKKASDKELYHEFGEFIVNSPLKKSK